MNRMLPQHEIDLMNALPDPTEETPKPPVKEPEEEDQEEEPQEEPREEEESSLSLVAKEVFESTQQRGFTIKYQLYYWAELVRRCPYPIQMVRGLEFANSTELARMGGPRTIFGIAASDPSLIAAGVTDASALTSMTHFGLSVDEAHYLSCDCHGQVSNDEMADRIGYVAHRRAA